MIKIVLAETQEDFEKIAHLARIIWNEHYTDILGKTQVDYMLGKFQSASAAIAQVANGFEYYLLEFNDTKVGYLSIKKEANAMFLSKLYILSTYRGKKIGKKALDFTIQKAKEHTFDKVRLTVNVHNKKALHAYEKLGFKNVGPIVADIGNGFIMDDYEMIKLI